MLNGARSIFLSGAVHYPRATPAMWPAIAASAKKLGLNMVEVRASPASLAAMARTARAHAQGPPALQTYAFWNVHEPVQGELQWSGGANLTAFLQVCGAALAFLAQAAWRCH